MELVPPHLTFDLAFPRPTCSIKLKNTSSEPRVFVIRTTDLLGNYRFRPSKGVLLPQQSVVFTVSVAEEKRQIMLTTKEYRCRDEFLVASRPVSTEFVTQYSAIDADDYAQRKALIDTQLGSTLEMNRSLFIAGFVPPPKESKIYEELSQRDNKSLWESFRKLFRSQKIYGSIVLSSEEVDLDVSGAEMSFKIMNRSDFFVVVSIVDDGSGLFELSHRNFMIEPKDSFHLKLRYKVPDNINRNGPPLAAARFNVMASNLFDPELLDAIQSATQENEKEKHFRMFWESTYVYRRIWNGSFVCRVDDTKSNNNNNGYPSCLRSSNKSSSLKKRKPKAMLHRRISTHDMEIARGPSPGQESIDEIMGGIPRNIVPL